jgi:four helix bundle protein
MRLSERNGQDLYARTKGYALRVVKLYAALPKRTEQQVFGKQVLRSGTSVGAHVAEALHGRSRAEFLSKIEGALAELEESRYWMELLIEAGFIRAKKLQPLIDETGELIAIMVTMAHRTLSNSRVKAN